MTFELADSEYSPESLRGGRWANTDAIPFNCPGCGRFAKITKDHHFYDGSFNRQTLFYSCTKCGDQYVELI